MNALILDGSRKDDAILGVARRDLESRLKNDNWDVKSYTLRDMEIAPCLGCFGCWIKTPGICVINDKGRDITKDAMLSDLWIFLTPITFGGYSFDMKKAVDRLLPIFVPIFTKFKGEVHHMWRPKKKPYFIVFGSFSHRNSKIEGIFKRLVERNSINFHSPIYASEIIVDSQKEEEIARSIEKILLNIHI